VRAGDTEFANKDKAIVVARGSHEEIETDFRARLAKLPVITRGEIGDMVDPVKLQALQREQAARHRSRAASELQQRGALYAQRKAHYKDVAAAYAAWLKGSVGPMSSETGRILDDSTVEMAVKCESDLIGLSEDLAKYTAESTRHAAQYEWQYQKTMSEPAAR
jgi:hypothetical protein